MASKKFLVQFFWTSTTDEPDEEFECDSLDPDNFSKFFLKKVDQLEVDQTVSDAATDCVVTRLS